MLDVAVWSSCVSSFSVSAQLRARSSSAFVSRTVEDTPRSCVQPISQVAFSCMTTFVTGLSMRSPVPVPSP